MVDAWLSQALCIEVGTSKFYPSTKGKYKEYDLIDSTCRACPVRAECLDAALRRSDEQGYWSNSTHATRQELLRFKKQEGVPAVRLDALLDAARMMASRDKVVDYTYASGSMFVL